MRIGGWKLFGRCFFFCKPISLSAFQVRSKTEQAGREMLALPSLVCLSSFSYLAVRAKKVDVFKRDGGGLISKECVNGLSRPPPRLLFPIPGCLENCVMQLSSIKCFPPLQTTVSYFIWRMTWGQ